MTQPSDFPYRRIVGDLRSAILEGRLPPGERLPSEYELAEKYGTSRPTVRRAIALLKGEGLVVTEQGRGAFVRPAEKFATPRMASGALFVDGSRLLLVRKTYGNHWDIPGGYVDRGESPVAACQREVREELGLEFVPTHLLVHDWAPNGAEGDKVLYVFGCGESSIDATAIKQLDGVELDGWKWTDVDRLSDLVIPRLARRLKRAHEAHRTHATLYLEHGEPAL